MNDFLDFYSRYIEALAKANALNKPIVFDALAAGGLTLVEVEFDGEGDSGQIHEIYAYAGDALAKLPESSLTLHQAAHNKADPKTTTVSLNDAIETLCYDYLSQCHGGWENNDGAYGTFKFDVGNRSIRLDFNERFSDSTNYSHDF
jgi:uncharacterized protein DUF6878